MEEACKVPGIYYLWLWTLQVNFSATIEHSVNNKTCLIWTPPIEEIYGIEVSTGTLSAVTDKIIHTVKEWQARPLESLYPLVWHDAIHYKIRENGKVASKAVYTILGVNLEGRNEVLGLYA